MNVLVLKFISTSSTVKTMHMLCITGSKCHDQLKLLQLIPYYVVAVMRSVRQANMYIYTMMT